jgi:hypothetical protein
MFSPNGLPLLTRGNRANISPRVRPVLILAWLHQFRYERYNPAAVEISYQLTKDDYRQGFKAFRKRTTLSRWTNLIAVAAFFITLASALVLSFFGRDKSFPNLFPLWAILAFWAWFVWGCPYYVAHKMIKGSRNASLPHTVNISESGLYSVTLVAETRFTWDLIVGWVEAERVFALFPSSISYFPIPKRAMTNDQQNELRTLLQAKISQPK